MQSIHQPRRMVAKGATVAAPTGGLNAYDGIPMMPPQDAILLRNFIPSAYGCSLRKGYVEHATGFDESVRIVLAELISYSL
jgi:hypothetical protein